MPARAAAEGAAARRAERTAVVRRSVEFILDGQLVDGRPSAGAMEEVMCWRRCRGAELGRSLGGALASCAKIIAALASL
jgi:hypothetical protein